MNKLTIPSPFFARFQILRGHVGRVPRHGGHTLAALGVHVREVKEAGRDVDLLEPQVPRHVRCRTWLL